MDRTIIPPSGFKDYVLNSGLGNCFPLSTMPLNHQGKIEELQNSSQKEAFKKLMDKITVVSLE